MVLQGSVQRAHHHLRLSEEATKGAAALTGQHDVVRAVLRAVRRAADEDLVLQARRDELLRLLLHGRGRRLHVDPQRVQRVRCLLELAVRLRLALLRAIGDGHGLATAKIQPPMHAWSSDIEGSIAESQEGSLTQCRSS